MKLKPCPFCGSAAEYEDVDNVEEQGWSVGCTSGACIAWVMKACYPTKTGAAKAWNKRLGKTLEKAA